MTILPPTRPAEPPYERAAHVSALQANEARLRAVRAHDVAWRQRALDVACDALYAAIWGPIDGPGQVCNL